MTSSPAAASPKPVYRFEERESDIRGITDIFVEGPFHEFAHVNTTRGGLGGRGPVLVRVEAGGRKAVFIAEKSAEAVGLSTYGRKGLRYGPGGRRAYVLLDEALVEGFLKAGEYVRTGRNGKEFENSARYAADLRAFAYGLIDLL